MATKTVQAADVIPEPGWTPHHPQGFLGIDNTPAGRLVGLADLLDWLKQARNLPDKPAFQALCDALEKLPSLDGLYELRRDDFAEPLPHNGAFGYPTSEEQAQEEARARRRKREPAWIPTVPDDWLDNGSVGRVQLIPEPISIVKPVQPGVPALLRLIRGDCRVLAALAIRFDLAHGLFNWGTVVSDGANGTPLALAGSVRPQSWAELVKWHPAHPQHLWDGDLCLLVVDECEAREKSGAKRIRDAMGRELGFSPGGKRIGQLVLKGRTARKKAQNEKRKDHHPPSSVFDVKFR